MVAINLWTERKIKMIALIVLGLISIIEDTSTASLKITKIECIAMDPEFARIDWCILKPESRYVQSIKIRATALQVPINDYEIRVQAMKRLNGWKPFLYDVTVNCSTVRRLNKVSKLAWDLIQNVSNIRNRFCPITQTRFEVVRLDNKYFDSLLQMLPIPYGDYGVFVTIASQGKPQVKGFAGSTIF